MTKSLPNIDHLKTKIEQSKEKTSCIGQLEKTK